jgi:hypothetical protein
MANQIIFPGSSRGRLDFLCFTVANVATPYKQKGMSGEIDLVKMAPYPTLILKLQFCELLIQSNLCHDSDRSDVNFVIYSH